MNAPIALWLQVGHAWRRVTELMHIDTAGIVILSVCELAALITIVHLWFRKRQMRVVARLVWSVVLLIPLFGLLFYGFLMNAPDAHSDRLTQYPPS